MASNIHRCHSIFSDVYDHMYGHDRWHISWQVVNLYGGMYGGGHRGVHGYMYDLKLACRWQDAGMDGEVHHGMYG